MSENKKNTDPFIKLLFSIKHEFEINPEFKQFSDKVAERAGMRPLSEILKELKEGE
jgi:hypothetical protein